MARKSQKYSEFFLSEDQLSLANIISNAEILEWKKRPLSVCGSAEPCAFCPWGLAAERALLFVGRSLGFVEEQEEVLGLAHEVLPALRRR